MYAKANTAGAKRGKKYKGTKHSKRGSTSSVEN